MILTACFGTVAGPTIFSIVYSSVTIYTALYSRILLNRAMSTSQWMAVLSVFLGLVLTATDSLTMGNSVIKGLILVIFGSAMHAFTYVASEFVMRRSKTVLTVEQNCAVQATVGAIVFLIWQLIYTLPRYENVLGDPMRRAGTTFAFGLFILCCFGLINLVHSLTFYHTLLNFPGGATSAGVMKGFQAVLVFLCTHIAFCGKTGGEEMCFSQTKLISLISVTGGVIWYGKATTLVGDNVMPDDIVEASMHQINQHDYRA